MSKKYRQKTGSILVIVVLITYFLLVPLLVLISQFGVYLLDRERTQNIVEAAALLAANDLSRITINDPNFGYVSLSNYPPIGKATRAPDGEPLPVTGINTLVGTVLQNTIVARELRNETMSLLSDADRASLETTVREINFMLTDSLSGDNEENWIDINGEQVDAV